MMDRDFFRANNDFHFVRLCSLHRLPLNAPRIEPRSRIEWFLILERGQIVIDPHFAHFTKRESKRINALRRAKEKKGDS